MRRIILAIIGLLTTFCLVGNEANINRSYVDDEGVLRWSADDSEITGFGVNYSLPFAHAYRMANRLGITHEEAIKQDVYHFARLGLDLYRVHIWDVEISDVEGNLLQNEHLRLFDFAVSEMKKRGMKFVITPIAFWGNGWPEPDFDTPGFATKYGKEGCLTHPDAIKAQENYLYQFLNHINPYTGLAYKDDPDIIAFEVSNEPHHDGTVDEVINYINRLVGSMRKTGTQTPIFYNMSHSIHLVDAYLNADVQGGTFQWYPAGLVANRQINGNFLPHVGEYYIPFADHPLFKKMAKIVYEFDPADVGGNYMYPAMARSFREAGIQLATHFDYDAMFLAPYNTNYGTHYMSLPYAPQKALSLKIASAVFHEVPRYSNYGGYPNNNHFEDFRIDYENDLVEWVTNETFLYSNNTTSTPDNPALLKKIAGYGNSPLINYDGKGAYFLDRIGKDSWRLEVMPDAHWIDDPYGRVSLENQVAAVSYNIREMKVDLSCLGTDFTIAAINDGNDYNTEAKEGTFAIVPGVFILQNKNSVLEFSPYQTLGNIRMNEFVAPEADLSEIMIKNNTVSQACAGTRTSIHFEVISPEPPQKVEVIMYGNGGSSRSEAVYMGADIYKVDIYKNHLVHGILNYYIVLTFNEKIKSFPAGLEGQPGDWDFYDHSLYTIKFIPDGEPVLVWSALDDWSETLRIWHPGVSLKPLGNRNAALHLKMDELPDRNLKKGSRKDYSFKFFFGDLLSGRSSRIANSKNLVLKAYTQLNDSQPIIVGLVDVNGIAYSVEVDIIPGKLIYNISLDSLIQSEFAVTPGAYPEYLPHFQSSEYQFQFKPEKVESVQVSIRQGKLDEVDLWIESIWME
ncbi:glycoside hydrolase 5 family protein [Alkalitalea saponilacus]|uniref:Cellulase (Glycosyl hydrolase family 5) n=1 Tax=Alkalitalea saponilacus TaxID=889453 RepID=A0A1T5HLI1_9BACT|nr:hypothetical protein [Alkalitalea saponilacus]ASB47820.1 hypothetical protein CDL62_00965 [Alkalitalea saponilacus]SKC21509.1 hypothetical protein SAMN03080601_02428 [Alkalitalea saponilacus]